MTDMKDSFRLTIQKKLGAEFKKCARADGYNYDLADEPDGTTHIYRGRAKFGEGDKLPFITILEDVDQGKVQLDQKNGSPHIFYDYRLLVQGFVDDDKANPTDPAHHLMADIEKIVGLLRISAQNSNFLFDIPQENGTVMMIGIEPGEVRPPDKDSAKANFWAIVWFKVCEDTSNPHVT